MPKDVFYIVILELKNGSNFGTVAQETSYKLSGQLLVAINRNHPSLVGMK